MAVYDPPDPFNDFFEEVHLGRRCLLCCANVILTYDSSTGGWCTYITVLLCRNFQIYLHWSWILLDFTAQTGRIIQKRPPRTQKNTPTTLTVKSKGGCVFHLTRNPQGGLYEWSPYLNIKYPYCSPTAMHSFSKGVSDSDGEYGELERKRTGILTNNCHTI